jgi:lipopolysaccharide/colanic/teichoic acid biosynthesis glycosyltransferase
MAPPAAGPQRRYRDRYKQWFDRVLLLAAAPLTVPLGLVLATAVRVTSGAPVLFRQTRVGKNGEDFEILKFRTMAVGDNPIVPDASRITPVGRWLRRTSLDELPQLVNVWRGEMSIVGPRPTLRYQVDKYDEAQLQRLDVAPGITGLAQVSGRNSLSWGRRIEADLEYVKRCSLVLDVQILARTLGVVVSGEGLEGHDPEDPLVSNGGTA